MTGWNAMREDIPERYLADLEARAPSLPLAMFRYAVSRFIDGDTDDKPATVRDELDRLADAAAGLAAMLDEMSLTALDSLAVQEVLRGYDGLAKRLGGDLRSIMGVAEMARRDAEQLVTTGRGLSANTQLVRDLARGLQMAGAAADARPNGELVQAFGIALTVVGKGGSKAAMNAAKTVASALKTIGEAGKE